MKAISALMRREFLEHRGAFLFAPFVLIALVIVLVSTGLILGDTPTVLGPAADMSSLTFTQVAFAGISAMWSFYLLVMLFFYYADAFSADQRNNSMLFWKSMPVSDLKILTAKALSGITILPALILGYAFLSMVLTYLLSFPFSIKLPVFPIASPLDMLITLFSVGIAAVVSCVLMILWFAPFLALVAGLSVLVKRWAIPAALLLISALIVSEGILTVGKGPDAHPIRAYLAYRAEGFGAGMDASALFMEGGYAVPFRFITQLVMRIDWFQLGLGVIVAIAVVYASSEYRRRRLDA